MITDNSDARTLYHDTKARAPFTPATIDPSTPYVPPSTETGAYEAGLTVVGEFDTVSAVASSELTTNISLPRLGGDVLPLLQLA